ncbi:MAG: chitobiase/beta-hexosaminidase C-terminal domain-containing protein [Firmicutes bacterium]|nr:chitobiase/beta-hexosaminidase C-terminal domain-containing protein [Bacillota bacterium]
MQEVKITAQKKAKPAWLFALLIAAVCMLSALAAIGGAGNPQTALAAPNTSWYNASANDFSINTADQLAGFAQLVNNGTTFAGKTVRLNADIDLSAYGKDFNDGKGWQPIGREWYYRDSISEEWIDESLPFSGVFDGNSKKITGLYINDIASEYAGLFGFVQGGTIQNLRIQDVDITAGRVAGGLVARLDGATVTDCGITGSVSVSDGVFGGGEAVGGRAFGGLAAEVWENTVIKNSYAAVNVIGDAEVGGLVGMMRFAQVENCYATGNVAAKSGNVGGLIGQARGGLINIADQSVIKNTFATGVVESRTYASRTSSSGGLIGNIWTTTVTHNVAQNTHLIGSGRYSPNSSSDWYDSRGRIAAASDATVLPNSTSTLANNYGFSGMVMSSRHDTSDKTATGRDGEDIDDFTMLTPAFWTGIGFSTSIWTLAEGKLPYLTALGKMNPIIPTSNFNSGGSVVQGEEINLFAERDVTEVRYTLDGTEPNAASPVYSEIIAGLDIVIPNTETILIKAKAFRDGQESPVITVELKFSLAPPISNPVITAHNAPILEFGTPVWLYTVDVDTIIYYTTDGTTPSESNGIKIDPNSGKEEDFLPVTMSHETRSIKAIAYRTVGGFTYTSAVADFNFTVRLPRPTPTLNGSEDAYYNYIPVNVFLGNSQLSSNAVVGDIFEINSVPGATVWYRIGEGSDFIPYNGPITLTRGADIWAYAAMNGMVNSETRYFRLSVRMPQPTIKMPDGTVIENGAEVEIEYGQNIQFITPDLDDFRFYYTTNGTTPTRNSRSTMGELRLTSTTTLNVMIDSYYTAGISVYPGEVATFTVKVVAAKPTANLVSGSSVPYSTPSVWLSSASPDVSVYYTLDGSDPDPDNPSSTFRFGWQGISLTAQTTIRAQAFGNNNSSEPSEIVEFFYQVITPAPTQSRPSLALNAGETVELRHVLPNAVIRYTLDGSDPTAASPVYTTPIIINQTTTVRARAFTDGYDPSPIVSWTFTVRAKIAGLPVASIAPGTVLVGTAISLSHPMQGVTLRYTTNGQNPTSAHPIFPSSYTINANTTLKVRAFMTGMEESDVTTFVYNIQLRAPIVSPAHGSVVIAGTRVAISGAGDIYYTTDGTEPTLSSIRYDTTRVVLEPNMTIRAKSFPAVNDGTVASAATAPHTFQLKAAAPTSLYPDGYWYDSTQLNVRVYATGQSGARIHWTRNGTEPTSGSPWVSSGDGVIVTNTQSVLKLKVFRDGMLPSDTVTFEYFLQMPRPTASIASGSRVMPEAVLSFNSAVPADGFLYVVRAHSWVLPPTASEFTNFTTDSIVLDYNPATVSRVNIWVKTIKDGLAESDVAYFYYDLMRVAPRPQGTFPGHGLLNANYNTPEQMLHHRLNPSVPSGAQVTFIGLNVRYTLDGTEPTERSPLFPAFLTVRYPITLTVKAFGNATYSPSITETYNVTVSKLEEIILDLGAVQTDIDDPGFLDANFKFDLNQLQGSVIYEEGKVKMFFGVEFSFDVSVSMDLDKTYNNLKNSIDNKDTRYLASAGLTLLPGGSFTYNKNSYTQIIGYLEGVMPGTALPQQLTGQLIIIHNSNTFLYNDITVLGFTIGYSVSVSTNIDFNGQLVLDTASRRLTPSGSIDIRFNIDAAAWVSIPVLGSAGIQGSAALVLHWNFSTGNWNLSLNGHIKVWATILGVTGSVTVYGGMHFSSSGTTQFSAGVSGRSLPVPSQRVDFKIDLPSIFYANGMFEPDSYENSPRDYLINQSDWLGEQLPADVLTVLQRSVYTDTAPLMAELANGTRVMVFLADNGSRDPLDPYSLNRTMLMYSVYDALNGTWSTPLPVWDSGTADFAPSIASDGTSIWLAWQKSSTTFNETAALADVLAAGEIVVAQFNGTTAKFGDFVTLTNNNFMDTSPRIAVHGEDVLVAWIQNTVNDIFGTSGKITRIMASRFINGVWSNAFVVAENLSAVTALDAGFINAQAQVAFVTDNDNNLNTIHDRTLHLATIYETTQNEILTRTVESVEVVNDKPISNPQFLSVNGTSVLSWHSEETILYLTNGKTVAVFLENVPNNNYKIISGFDKTAIIYSAVLDEVGYLLARMLDDETWSSPFILYETGGFARSFDVLWEQSGDFYIAFNHSKVAIDIAEGSDTATFTETNDLCVLTVTPSEAVRIIGVLYSDSDIKLGQDLPIQLVVENTGGVAVDSITVYVDSNQLIPINIDGGLQPGESKIINFNLAVPQDMTAETRFNISIGTDSRNITLGLANFSLNLERASNSDGTVTISANIQNNGVFDSEVKLLVYKGGLDDADIIDMIDLGLLTAGETLTEHFSFNPALLGLDGDGFEVLYFVLIYDQVQSKSISNFAVLFANNNPLFDIALDFDGTHDFNSADFGYTAQTPHSVQVTNTGDQQANVRLTLMGEDADKFSLSVSNLQIAVDGSADFTVAPKIGLAPGQYSAIVQADNNGIIRFFTVEFTVTGTLPANTHMITVQNDGNGTAGAQQFFAEAGTQITLTATPNEGYRFLEWQVISDNATITNNQFTMPAGEVIIKALFQIIPPQGAYNITVQNSGNGTVNAGAEFAQVGEIVTLTATPDNGYRFVEWQVIEGSITVTDNQFTMPDGAVTVRAIFERITYTVTFQNDTATVAIDKDGGFTFIINSGSAVFERLEVTNSTLTLIEGTDYTVESGSTKITLTTAGLEKLKAGEHTLTVHFTDGGTATVTFTITAPQTHPNGLPGWAIALIVIGGVLLLGGTAAAIVIAKKRKKPPV